MDMIMISALICILILQCHSSGYITPPASGDGANVYWLDASGNMGRRFDGIGAISGGGATSKLLTNYPEKQKKEVLDYLFKPNFGASLHILKVEIGGDAQSTEGTESSHMHNPWEVNFHRGYEWNMMVEAKKRNPHIKLYGLPWGFPGWLGSDTIWPYDNPSRLADYVVTWVQGARDVYNLTIDYLGIWNEKPYTIEYVKTLRQTLDSRGFPLVQLVVADLPSPGNWQVASDMAKDQEFNATVNFIGVHYPGTHVPDATKASGKPVWSSEDSSSGADEGGARCLAKIINRNYVNGLMTSTIVWNLLASYYDDLPIGRHSLMVANQPWSGHYEVTSPIWIAAHTTQFTSPGWMYLPHGGGTGFLSSGGSMVSLVSPDKQHLTVVIETIDTCSSPACMGPGENFSPVKAANITIYLKAPFTEAKSLNVWHTRIGHEYFINKAPLKVINGTVSISVQPEEVITLTTVSSGRKGEYTSIPQSQPFPLPYSDNFDNTPIDQEADNFAQQVGVFEIQADPTSNSSHQKTSGTNRVLQQMALQAPVHWCPLSMTQPITYIGNYNWTDVHIEVDIRFPAVNATNGIFIAAHVDNGGCYTILDRGVYMFLQKNHQEAVLSMDLAKTLGTTKHRMQVIGNTWYKLSLITKGDRVTGLINNQVVFNTTVTMNPTNGFVAIGTDNFGLAHFDNFQVKPS